jgi:hypothetical protein
MSEKQINFTNTDKGGASNTPNSPRHDIAPVGQNIGTKERKPFDTSGITPHFYFQIFVNKNGFWVDKDDIVCSIFIGKIFGYSMGNLPSEENIYQEVIENGDNNEVLNLSKNMKDGEYKLATFLCWNVNWCPTDDTGCGGFYPEFKYKFLKIEE